MRGGGDMIFWGAARSQALGAKPHEASARSTLPRCDFIVVSALRQTSAEGKVVVVTHSGAIVDGIGDKKDR